MKENNKSTEDDFLLKQIKEKYKKAFLDLVDFNIKKRGLIHVLGNGIEDIMMNGKFELVYFKPNSNINKGALQNYKEAPRQENEVGFHNKLDTSQSVQCQMGVGRSDILIRYPNRRGKAVIKYGIAFYKKDCMIKKFFTS